MQIPTKDIQIQEMQIRPKANGRAKNQGVTDGEAGEGATATSSSVKSVAAVAELEEEDEFVARGEALPEPACGRLKTAPTRP